MRRLELVAEAPAPTETEFPSTVPGDGRAMTSWSGADRRERRRRRSWGAAAREAVTEARERLEAARWEDAEAGALVGLYAVLHESVYGVEPAEVLGDAFPGARSAADKLSRELGGAKEVVEFLRWVWSRERARERRREPGEGSRIGWRLMFCSRVLVTDWKVDLARQGRIATARPTNGGGGAKR